jgi:arsenical pump membrane protein
LSDIVLDSIRQSWSPFVLVAGLLLVGRVAHEDGLFEATGARLAAAPLSPFLLLVGLLGLVAVVTAVLNLDTAVVFVTPVLLHAARRRALDERPFLYGSVFMANSASLLLPGSNLTNMLVLSRGHVGGLAFAREMAPAWLLACAFTVAVVAVAFPLSGGRSVGDAAPRLVIGAGAAGVALSALLVLFSPEPALPVLAVGLGVTALRGLRPAIDPKALAGLFALTVALGVLTRAWPAPADVLAHAGRVSTALIAALSANAVNNLPAAVLFSADAPPHPRALLLGLDLGPNLAVTGSLSAYLWFQAARTAGSRPSIATYSRLGAVLVPLTLAAGLFADGAILTRS